MSVLLPSMLNAATETTYSRHGPLPSIRITVPELNKFTNEISDSISKATHCFSDQSNFRFEIKQIMGYSGQTRLETLLI
jgi:hypothetical protein